MYPETYSQYDEQQAILGWFDSDKRVCAAQGSRFLDIGAWDPKVFSNTRALFEQGWGGLAIEPSPSALLGLLKEYGNEARVRILQAAVSVERAPVEMWMTADCTSTSQADFHDSRKASAGYLGKATVLTITWDQINLWYGGFDFVNIDAEGVSVDLFHAMVGSGAHPKCVCCEHDGTRFTELAAAATRVGYKVIYSNGTNAVMGL